VAPAAPERADIVVVGAGAAGLATARELAVGGRAPLVLERFELGHRRGSSHGNSRIVRLAHDRNDDVVDALAAYAGWQRLERDTQTQLLVTVGGLDFGAALIGPTLDALSALNMACEVLEPAEVERRFPAVAADGQPALFQPDAAIGLADVTMRVLAADARRHGAQIRERTPVLSLAQRDDAVVLGTAAGTIEARAVVLAAGGWIGELAAQAGMPLPVRPTLQAAVHLKLAAAPVGSVPTIVEQTADGRLFYSVPSPGGDEIKGGWHDAGPPADLDGSRDADEALVATFEDWATARYRGLGPRADAYGCIYTWLPDDRFHLERHGRVVVASCCSGRGFKFVPSTGALAARLAHEAAG
jgi:glycine/D-amino acid oxidase-like deaminating enzyme